MKTTCNSCDGKGIMYVADGLDDFAEEYCYCVAGKNLEIRHQIKSLAVKMSI